MVKLIFSLVQEVVAPFHTSATLLVPPLASTAQKAQVVLAYVFHAVAQGSLVHYELVDGSQMVRSWPSVEKHAAHIPNLFLDHAALNILV